MKGLALILGIVLVLGMVNVSYSQTLPQANGNNRVAFTGDVDCNANQKKDFQNMKDAGVTTVVIAGDYAYSNGKCVLDYLKQAGYTNANVILADGNHDKCADVKAFTGESSCYYTKSIGNVQYFVLDLEAGLTPSDTQFKNLKGWLEDSDAEYKVIVIHEPFVTAKTTHPANGFFDELNPIFEENKVDIVDQAHNHNYQRFFTEGLIYYLTTGTGYHDEGTAMYDIKGSSDPNGGELQKGIDNKNGFTVVDFSYDDHSFKGYFLSSDKIVMDEFGQTGTGGGQEPGGIIDTNPNEVCVCKNDTAPPVENQTTMKIAQNVTVTAIGNITEVGNATKILTDNLDVALIPLKNNTKIKILANVTG